MVSESQVNRARIKFHPDWQGETPSPLSPSDIKEKASKIAGVRGFSPQEREEIANFLLEYDKRFFSVRDTNGSCHYHRQCGGGAVRRIDISLFCSKCGDVEEVILPDFLT